mmetsp:Transcript_80/g.182  ORF Transcript_80/g.182 Transcript_80/m.182 type:complete len:98 (-) Transcript_80:175-468(-)
MSAPTTFDEATKIAADPNILKVSYSDKQKLYGFFKIASTSSAAPTSARPGMFSIEGRAKWDAWKAAGESIAGASDIVEAAKLQYTNIVRVAMGAESL